MQPDHCAVGVDPAEPVQAVLLLGTGLAMSLGHCLGMCGPLVVGFSASQRARGLSRGRLAPALLLYNAGRVTSYTLLGTALGLVGPAASALGGARAAEAAISVAIGAGMALLALGLLGLLPSPSWIESSPLAGGAVRRIRMLLGTAHPAGHYGLGLANGFLPCGPVAVVALATATAGNPLRGGLSLLLYGLGTLPALLLLGLGSGLLAPRLRVVFHRAGAGLVLLLALQLLLRGVAALGGIGHLRWGDVLLW